MSAGDPGPAAPAPFERALVVRFGRIGDMLVVTPALRALRQAAPSARIDVLTTADGSAVLSGNPRIDRVHVLGWRRVPRAFNPERARLLRTLGSARYDTVFLLEGADRYHALIRETGVPRVLTFAGPGRPPGPASAERRRRHEVHNMLAVLELAGVPPAGVACEFAVGEAARTRAGGLLAEQGIEPGSPLIGMHAGQFRRRAWLRRRPHAKAWPAERYAEVAASLLDRLDGHVLLTGAAAERRLNARIARRLPPARTIDLAGRTSLDTLAAVLERCAVFIAPDTGPAHLAAAVGTPLVALFGPKPPDIMGPLGDDERIVRLYPPPSSLSERERGGHHPRMWAITAADVTAAALSIARSTRTGGTRRAGS